MPRPLPEPDVPKILVFVVAVAVTALVVGPAAVGGVLLVFALALAAGALRVRLARLDWPRLAAERGLEYTRSPDSAKGDRIEGTIDGVEVLIDRRPPDGGVARAGRGTRLRWSLGVGLGLRVRLRGAIPRSLGLAPEGLRSRVDRALGRGDVLVGDEDFDEAIRVSGDEVTALALLDLPTRELLRSLAQPVGPRLEDGDLLFDRSGVGVGRPARTLDDVLDALLELARRLRQDDDDLAVRLATRVAREPVAGVRRRCLELLLSRHGDRDEAVAAARALLDEPLRAPNDPSTDDAGYRGEVVVWNPFGGGLFAAAFSRTLGSAALPEARRQTLWARLAAASALGRAGRDELARLADNPELPDDLRAAASKELADPHGDGDGRLSLTAAGGQLSVAGGGTLAVADDLE